MSIVLVDMARIIAIRDLEKLGGDRKFSKIVELLGPQNLKMVELLGSKFDYNSHFVKIFVVSSSPRPILSLRSLLYIIFDYKRQQFSNLRHFLQIMKIDQLLLNFWNDVYKNGCHIPT